MTENPFTKYMSAGARHSFTIGPDELVSLTSELERQIADGVASHEASVSLVWAALQMAREALGDTVISYALGRRSPLNSDYLRLLAHRLDLVSAFFSGADDPLPMGNVAEEVRAIRGGDDPAMLVPLRPRRRGEKPNAYRLASREYRALEWSSVLSYRGASVAERTGSIALAFGAPWDTIRKWRKRCEARLGAEVVADREARLAANLAEGRPVFGEIVGLSQGDALKRDGELYRRELGYKG